MPIRPPRSLFRILALITLLLLGPLQTLPVGAAGNGLALARFLPGGGRVLSLTSANDPFRTTGTAISSYHPPGSDTTHFSDDCLKMPAETDLRLIWIDAKPDAYAVTLRFFAPITFLTELYGHPVKHLVTLEFTAPDGTVVTETVGRSGKISLKRGTTKLDTAGAASSLYLTDLVMTLPRSSGVGTDWVMQAKVKITGTGNFCDDPRLGQSEFHIETTPVLVGSLTGENQDGLVKTLPIAMAFDQKPKTARIDYTWQTRATPPEARVETLHLEHNTDGHLIAVLTMGGEIASRESLLAAGIDTLIIGVDLVPPSFLGLKHPFQVQLSTNPWPPTTATVIAPGPNAYQNIVIIGSIPVAVDGRDLRLDMTAFTPTEPVMTGELPTGETLVPQFGDGVYVVTASRTLERANGEDLSDEVTIEIVGAAVRLTTASGESSVGWVDPYDNESVIDGKVHAGVVWRDAKGCIHVIDITEYTQPDTEYDRAWKDYKDALQALGQLQLVHGLAPLLQLGEPDQQELEKAQDAIDRAEAKMRKLNPLLAEEEISHCLGGVNLVDLAGPRALPTGDATLVVSGDELATDEAPAWAKPPSTYWNAEDRGLRAVSFGLKTFDPFPFPSVTNWIPGSWNLPPVETGWAIRVWSTASLHGGGSASVFSPFVAAALLTTLPTTPTATPTSQATPVAATWRQSPRHRRGRTRASARKN